MRKLSKTRFLDLKRNTLDTYPADTRQRRIPGATIASGPGSQKINIDTYFARPPFGASVTGAVSNKIAQVDHVVAETIALSDGTRISFATASQFD